MASHRPLNARGPAALTFAEPAAAQVVAQLGDDDLVAPTLLWHEMANVCLTKMRIHPTEREQLLTAFRMAARLDLHVVDVDHAAAIELAEPTDLSVLGY